MKRFWLVFLSAGLIMAFSASAFAVDVKVSGSYYAAGMYQNKTTFVKNGYYATPSSEFKDWFYSNGDPSTAFYFQRLRVQTDFIVSPCLKLVTRFDAMERIWGGARSELGGAPDTQSAATKTENENIGFDWAYIEYVSPIGMFDVGYMDDGGWGTVFGDSSVPQGIISWVVQKNGWIGFLQILKISENSHTAITSSAATDNDTDKYQGGVIYEWKGNQAGLLGIYYREASGRPESYMMYDVGFTGNVFVLEPYVIFQIGPAKIQAELDYAWGKIKADQVNPLTIGQDIKVDNLAGWVDATVNLKQFYFGGSIAYVAGNDWSNYNHTGKMEKVKGGFLTGGMDWNPTLLLFNNQRDYWAGAIYGNNVTSTSMNYISQQYNLNDTGMYNAWFFQGRAGFRPNDKLDIMASVSHASADSKTLLGAPDAVSSNYGTEIDLIGTYKITNNLSYMAGLVT
ncbi:MAG: hypothetical protein WC373_08320, partial [Smithella sp.]